MTRYERELIRALHDLEFAVMRAPSSGSRTNRDLPDLLVGHGVVMIDGMTGPIDRYSKTWAIEHKSGKDTTLYVAEAEVEALGRFSYRFGAKPLLAARYTSQGSGREHYLVRPNDARLTGNGTYGLPYDGIPERAAYVVTPDPDGGEPSIDGLDG